MTATTTAERTCAFAACRQTFTVPSARGSRIYCSTRCRDRANESKRPSRAAPKLALALAGIARFCEYEKCGKALPSDAHPDKRFCTRRCWARHYFTQVWYPAHPKQPDAWVDRMCAHCGNVFKVHLKARRKKEYCTRTCRNASARSRKMERAAAGDEQQKREQPAEEHDFADALQVCVAPRREEHHETDESHEECEVDEHPVSLPRA